MPQNTDHTQRMCLHALCAHTHTKSKRSDEDSSQLEDIHIFRSCLLAAEARYTSSQVSPWENVIQRQTFACVTLTVRIPLCSDLRDFLLFFHLQNLQKLLQWSKVKCFGLSGGWDRVVLSTHDAQALGAALKRKQGSKDVDRGCSAPKPRLASHSLACLATLIEKLD